MVNPSIFRAYDIRGSSISDINSDSAYKIGLCFAKLTISEDNNLICVGRDGRLSSNAIYEALSQGINDAGAKILSVGLVPTPALYFADQKFKPASSIMITGSHNPKNDNGFKMLVNSKPFFGEQIQNLLHNIIATKWSQKINRPSTIVDPVVFGARREESKPISNRRETNNDVTKCQSIYYIQNHDISQEYVDRILQDQYIASDLRIAWDPSNGAACNIVAMLQKILPNSNFIINTEIDGNFPNHHPDPTVKENLSQLIHLVKEKNCAFGIGFDGDADRIGIVTSKGNIIWGDQLLCFFAKDILQTKPNATIIADVKASQILFDQIAQYGGNPLIWKTGHSFIKNKMAETGAILAGEMSGHIFFADKYYGYDDAIYAAIRLIDLVSRTKTDLDSMLDSLPIVYNTPEMRISTKGQDKFCIIEQVKQQLQKASVLFCDIDGVRVSMGSSWWLLRASNTEEAIIARCEASSEESLQDMVSILKTLISQYNLELPCQ